MRTSASAIDTADLEHDGCLRKWWFKHLKHVPTPPTGSTTFGDVLHAVAERFLEADENGLKEGQPVSLYPEGWESPWNRFSGERSKEALTMEEQSLVKTLIEAAIEEGVLMRVEGREIERAIDFVPFEDVQVTGFIDLLEPEAIRDHKTTKDMKWAKSAKRDVKESLYTNIQLMLYAYWYFTDGGYDKSKLLTLSHQYYVKNVKKPRVEKREVKVDWKEVEQFFKNKICPIMEMMLTYKDAEKWQDIPLPTNVAGACRKFGGCPFVKICTEQESLEVFTRKIERQLGTNKDKPAGDSKKQGDKTMTKLEEIKARLAAKQTTPAPVVDVQPEPEPAPVKKAPKPVQKAEEPVALNLDPQEGEQVAPWYNPAGCKACADNPIKGMNSTGVAPCKVCDVWAKKEGRPMSSDYIWDVEAGKLVVRDMEGNEIFQAPTVTAPVKVKEVTKSEPKPTVAQYVPEVEAPPAVKKPVEKPAVEVAENAVEPELFFGEVDFLNEREKFTLLIGCAIVESKTKQGNKFGTANCRVTGEELLIIVDDQMRKVAGEIRWSQMNNFDKKDAIALYGKQIGESLGGSTVTVSRLPKSSLLEAVILAIRPFAFQVIQAMVD